MRIISLINYLSLCKTPQVHVKTQILEEKLFQVHSTEITHCAVTWPATVEKNNIHSSSQNIRECPDRESIKTGFRPLIKPRLVIFLC